MLIFDWVIIMLLKELRISKKITQSQAASLVGVSLRSYKEYENNKDKINTIKYNYIYSELSKFGYIDEEHGILDLKTIIEKVGLILSKYDVEYCYLFGSYAKKEPNETSDVDLLVSTSVTGMAFFGMAENLREILQKKVDLLNLDQLNNNKELLNEILKDGIKIYDKRQQILFVKDN